jgi:hypothetical protein
VQPVGHPKSSRQADPRTNPKVPLTAGRGRHSGERPTGNVGHCTCGENPFPRVAAPASRRNRASGAGAGLRPRPMGHRFGRTHNQGSSLHSLRLRDLQERNTWKRLHTRHNTQGEDTEGHNIPSNGTYTRTTAPGSLTGHGEGVAAGDLAFRAVSLTPLLRPPAPAPDVRRGASKRLERQTWRVREAEGHPSH